MTIKIRNNIKGFVSHVEQKRKQFLTTVGFGAMALSKEKTPIAFSLLINSIYMDIRKKGYSETLAVGYGAEYAAALNGVGGELPRWSPIPLPKTDSNGRQAPATNMNAEPGFLTKAFESQEGQQNIEQALKIFKV